MDELHPKTHSEPLPKTREGVVEWLKPVLELSHVDEIRITPLSVEVQRRVRGDVPVLPHSTPELGIDPDFLFSYIDMFEVEFRDDSHPFLQLLEACGILHAKGLQVCCIVAPAGEWMGAFLGLEEGTIPQEVFGIRVVYSTSPNQEQKLCVVGGSSRYVTDARAGVLIDLGV